MAGQSGCYIGRAALARGDARGRLPPHAHGLPIRRDPFTGSLGALWLARMCSGSRLEVSRGAKSFSWAHLQARTRTDSDISRENRGYFIASVIQRKRHNTINADIWRIRKRKRCGSGMATNILGCSPSCQRVALHAHLLAAGMDGCCWSRPASGRMRWVFPSNRLPEPALQGSHTVREARSRDKSSLTARQFGGLPNVLQRHWWVVSSACQYHYGNGPKAFGSSARSSGCACPTGPPSSVQLRWKYAQPTISFYMVKMKLNDDIISFWKIHRNNRVPSRYLLGIRWKTMEFQGFG
jgi:hypothetical protein